MKLNPEQYKKAYIDATDTYIDGIITTKEYYELLAIYKKRNETWRKST